MPEERLLTVSQFNSVAKAVLENEPLLSGATVLGEISNFKRYPSGHLYFTLKDAESSLACTMFQGYTTTLRFAPADGMKVRVRGSATVYGKDGRYQLLVRSMEADGVGGLYAAYEKLKAKLQSEGLFDQARKKKLPRFPGRVGVITSPAGAAIRDILNVTGRRYPCAQILIYPSAVQGEEAPEQLRAAVALASKRNEVDVLIIGRGGGSIEDLWAFNDEKLARALAACPIPTISAVGHETDFTICDFVCDRRAPTPSAAAELAVPDREELYAMLMRGEERMSAAMRGAVALRRKTLSDLSSARVLADRAAPLRVQKEKVAQSGERMKLAFDRHFERKTSSLPEISRRFDNSLARSLERRREALSAFSGKLVSLNPLAVLGRGYAAVFDGEGGVVRSVNGLRVGDRVRLRLQDGEATVRTEDLNKTSPAAKTNEKIDVKV